MRNRFVCENVTTNVSVAREMKMDLNTKSWQLSALGNYRATFNLIEALRLQRSYRFVAETKLEEIHSTNAIIESSTTPIEDANL